MSDKNFIKISKVTNRDLLEWELEWLKKQEWITVQAISSILYNQATFCINEPLWHKKPEIDNSEIFANLRIIVDRLVKSENLELTPGSVWVDPELAWIPHEFKENTLYPGANDY